jgi:hypothetical protein
MLLESNQQFWAAITSCLAQANSTTTHLSIHQETQAFLAQSLMMHKFQEVMSKSHQHVLATLTTRLAVTSTTNPIANPCPIATCSSLYPVTADKPNPLPQKQSSIATVSSHGESTFHLSGDRRDSQ